MLFQSLDSGLRVPAVGGNANNGGNDGPEYLNANNAVSTSNANYGSPLNLLKWFVCQLPLLIRNETSPHGGKYNLKRSAGRRFYGRKQGKLKADNQKRHGQDT